MCRSHQLQALDLRRVELAAVRWEDDDHLAGDQALEHDPIHLDHVGRVDDQAGAVVEVLLVDPPLRQGRVALGLGHPAEPDDEVTVTGVAVHGDGLDLPAEEVALSLVLDLDLSTHETGKDVFGELHGASSG